MRYDTTAVIGALGAVGYPAIWILIALLFDLGHKATTVILGFSWPLTLASGSLVYIFGRFSSMTIWQNVAWTALLTLMFVAPNTFILRFSEQLGLLMGSPSHVPIWVIPLLPLASLIFLWRGWLRLDLLSGPVRKGVLMLAGTYPAVVIGYALFFKMVWDMDME